MLVILQEEMDNMHSHDHILRYDVLSFSHLMKKKRMKQVNKNILYKKVGGI